MNKKGFTLIELLAVIVILAIIALITTPIILNMIEDSRKGAAKDSAYGYIEAVEYNNSMNMINKEKYPLIEDGTDIDISTIKDKVNIKGTKPTSGNITVEKGRITKASLCIDSYKVDYDGNIVTKVVKDNKCKGNNSSSDTEEKQKNYGDIIYYNPETAKICTDYTEENSKTGIKSGCMKWYYIGLVDNKENYILDHNTSSNINWDELSYDSQITPSKALEQDTINWNKNISKKIISADEIADIVGASSDETIKWSSSKPYGMDKETESYYFYLDGNGNSYNPTFDQNGVKVNDGWQLVLGTPNDSNKSKYSWLYDYTNCTNRGCTKVDDQKYDSIPISGYWTSSKLTNSNSNYWVVTSNGTVSNVSSSQSGYGIRPVISLN